MLLKADKVHKGGSFLLDNFVTLASTIGVMQSTGITTTNAQTNDNQQEKALLCTEKNLSWEMSSLNHQNFLGNIYLSGIDNIFLKKKIGKNKFSASKTRWSFCD